MPKGAKGLGSRLSSGIGPRKLFPSLNPFLPCPRVMSSLAISCGVLHTGGRDFHGQPGCRDPDVEII